MSLSDIPEAPEDTPSFRGVKFLTGIMICSTSYGSGAIKKASSIFAMLATIPYALPIIIARQADWRWAICNFCPDTQRLVKRSARGYRPSTSVRPFNILLT